MHTYYNMSYSFQARSYNMPLGREKLTMCGAFFTIVSFLCYTVTIGFGWTLSQKIHPEDSLVLTGAIISTLPIISIVGLCGYFKYVCSHNRDTSMGLVVFTLVQSLAAVLQAVGATLFITVAATLGDSKALSHGVGAGVFGMLTALICISSQFLSCAAAKSGSRRYGGTHYDSI